MTPLEYATSSPPPDGIVLAHTWTAIALGPISFLCLLAMALDVYLLDGVLERSIPMQAAIGIGFLVLCSPGFAWVAHRQWLLVMRRDLSRKNSALVPQIVFVGFVVFGVFANVIEALYEGEHIGGWGWIAVAAILLVMLLFSIGIRGTHRWTQALSHDARPGS